MHGVTTNDGPARQLPLAGVRILALEQMQALPYATQLLAHLGADVVKVEPPGSGDSGRASLPAMTDPDGRKVGATFLRNNLGKRSICVNLKDPRGRDLAQRFDVVAENSKAGAMARLGLGYSDVAAVHPAGIFVSVSGFGNSVPTPYQDWPAYAPIVEAMSGIYEMKRMGDEPPTVAPVGALGDISAALFAAIGILAALRHREATGSAPRTAGSSCRWDGHSSSFGWRNLSGIPIGSPILGLLPGKDGWITLKTCSGRLSRSGRRGSRRSRPRVR